VGEGTKWEGRMEREGRIRGEGEGGQKRVGDGVGRGEAAGR